MKPLKSNKRHNRLKNKKNAWNKLQRQKNKKNSPSLNI